MLKSLDHGANKIDSIKYSLSLNGDEYIIEVKDRTCCSKTLFSGNRLERPPKPDTQEKIDADSELTAREYCNKHGIDASYDPDYVRDDYPEMLMRRHLLERQRKLDGVE